MKIKEKGLTLSQSDQTLDRFYRISKKVSSSLELSDTLENIAQGLLEITGYDFCNIFLLNHRDNDYAENWYSTNDEFKGEKIYLPEAERLKRLFKTGRNLFYCGSDMKSSRPKLDKYFKKNKISCSLHIPLMHQHIKGCVLLDKSSDGCELSSDKLSKGIDTLVRLSATALDNAIAHKIILRQRDRWHAIFDEINDGMVVVGDNIKISRVNKSFAKMLDREVLSFELKDLEEVFFKKEAAHLGKELKKIFLEGVLEVTEREVILKTRTGTKQANMKISFVRRDGDFPKIMLTFEDVSQLKRLEKSKDEFVSIISHELRSPLTTMRGFLSLLQKEDKYGGLNAKQKKFVERAYESTERMSDMVEEILTVNKLAVGIVDLDIQPTDLKEVAREAIRDLSSKAEEKKIRIAFRNDKEVPLVPADKARVYQIMINLLDNAIKYTGESGGVQIFFKENGGNVVFSVSDTGIGIAEDELNKVFDKFSRTTRAVNAGANGSGLGLFIVKRLVKAHGGDIWVESIEGEGSIFNVSFKKKIEKNQERRKNAKDNYFTNRRR